jgi:hypothetical protein
MFSLAITNPSSCSNGTMKDNPRQKGELNLDALLGVRPFFKPSRAVGRLPQLNKHARKMRKHHSGDKGI